MIEKSYKSSIQWELWFMGLYSDNDDHELISVGSLLPFKLQFERWKNNKGMFNSYVCRLMALAVKPVNNADIDDA